jgi:hypothetical protein
MHLKCYALTPEPPAIVPASPSREWMDNFPDRHAYRCLPLDIANVHGWELRSPCSFAIHWNGGKGTQDITFEGLDNYAHLNHLVHTNFSRGIVTFLTGYLFVTEPGWHLLATGPINQPRDGISPLTGIIETDWLPYPFTMNWQLTRPGTVRFERGDPFCLIFPIRNEELESTELEIHDIADNAELEKQYTAWREKRDDFMARYRAGDQSTIKEAWQKYYFRGIMPDTGARIADHTQKVRLRAPVDRRNRGDAKT